MLLYFTTPVYVGSFQPDWACTLCLFLDLHIFWLLEGEKIIVVWVCVRLYICICVCICKESLSKSTGRGLKHDNGSTEFYCRCKCTLSGFYSRHPDANQDGWESNHPFKYSHMHTHTHACTHSFVLAPAQGIDLLQHPHTCFLLKKSTHT